MSSLNPDYNQNKTDQKYSHLIRTKKDPTVPIDFIYNLAKKENIKVEAIDEKNIINQLKLFIQKNYNMKRNDISRNIEIDGKPITDIDLNSIFINCKTFIDKANKELVKSVIFSDFTKTYNPFHVFLHTNIKIKGTGNIDKLISTITTDTENHDLFIKKWLTSLMASINGKHSPLVLVLVGGQNTGKTEWFRRLLPDELKSYYAEAYLNKGNALLQIKEISSALKNYNKAITIKTSDPELNWNNTSKRCYSGTEQHAGCSPFYAMESREATKDESRSLKIELIHIGYELDILNNWDEPTQFERDINEIHFNII